MPRRKCERKKREEHRLAQRRRREATKNVTQTGSRDERNLSEYQNDTVQISSLENKTELSVESFRVVPQDIDNEQSNITTLCSSDTEKVTIKHAEKLNQSKSNSSELVDYKLLHHDNRVMVTQQSVGSVLFPAPSTSYSVQDSMLDISQTMQMQPLQKAPKRKCCYKKEDANSFSSAKKARLEKRRLQYRKRYQEDETFRKRKQDQVRKTYRNFSEYRNTKKQATKVAYNCNKKYRDKKQQASKVKYNTDEQFKDAVKQANKIKYRTDSKHKKTVKKASIDKYRTDPKHKEAVKQASKVKYRTEPKHNKAVKQASKVKYRTEPKHKEAVKLASKVKYRTDPKHKEAVKQASKVKYRTDPKHKEAVKQASKVKYRTDPKHKEAVKQASKVKYRTDPIHKEAVKQASKVKYSRNPQLRENLKQLYKAKYRNDSQFRGQIKRLKRLKYRKSDLYRNIILATRRKRYKSDVSVQKKKMLYVTQIRKASKDEQSILSIFRKEINKKPKFVCCVCHKFLWRDQFIICKPQDYSNKACDSGQMAEKCITVKFLHKCKEDCDEFCEVASSHRGKLWICYTCHRKLLKGDMPPEAQCNNLELCPIPEELKNLNDLERHLLSIRIPFMKMVSLPKGGQKGVIGPCVSVPSEIQKTTKTLPRSDIDTQLIRVKLKRKLPYRGHYKYQFISTKKLKIAFEYLQQNNIWYKDVVLDHTWQNPIQKTKTHIDGDSNGSSEDDDDDVDDDDDDIGKNKNGCDSKNMSESQSMQGAPVDTCLQPVDIGQEVLDQYFDDLFCVAPAEDSTPVSMLRETGNEAMSFPCLFPEGSGSYSNDRPVSLTPLRYFHNRLMNADSRFASDSTYIFYAQYISELQQVISNVSIALRKGTAFDEHGAPITSRTIKDKESLKKILQCDQGYKFLKPVRGTPPYWQTTMKDLFAVIRQKGIPTWFCTFSAADMRWTEIIDTILEQRGSSQKTEDLDWTEKCEVLSSNPVMNAVMFNHRFNAFMKFVITSDAQPIGQIETRFHRIEFQKRGSPHSHCLFWTKNSPKLDEDDDETVCTFIDKYVTCHLPDQNEDPEMHEIVSSVQQHSKSHSKSCRKKGTTCRFHFPRPPSEHTFVSRPECLTDPSCEKSPEQLINEAKKILQAIWDVILNPDIEVTDITTENLFNLAGVTQEQYEHASNIMTKRATIVLKRSPGNVWINQYNPTLLRCWNANMDIQYVLDAYSCVMYIISYISKAEKELGMILEETRKEAVEGNLDAEQAMKKIGCSYFHQREICVQEAVYRVCGFHLKESSCKIQFVPVGENPVKMSIPLRIIQAKSQHEEDQEIWMSSLSDKYKARPVNREFEAMCYATFCSLYRILSPSQIPKNPTTTVHQLQNNLGFIQRRTKSQPAVIRYPRFSQDKYPEQYYQSILQLFLPHRTNKQLKPKPFKTYEEFYNCGAVKLIDVSSLKSVSVIVDENRSVYEKDAQVLDDAQKLVEKVGPLEDAWATFASEAEKERDECEMEMDCLHSAQEDTESDIPDLSSAQKKGQLQIIKTKFTTEQILPLLRSLNTKQKEVFYFVRQWCLDKVNGKDPQPFHLFITGGAGTGKSHLVKCLYNEAQKILSPSAPNPDDIVALLTAPTGTAAFNIGGTTLHSAFSLSKYLSLPYKGLRDDAINTLRMKLQNLQILFIDEISMVDKKVLIYVSERLRQIKITKSRQVPFGNICVIAVGDFYQLPPVRQASLLKKDARQPVNLFTDFFHVAELDEIMRQKDVEFASMLNRFRVHRKNDQFSDDDIHCLEQCKLNYQQNEALHVFPTNSEVFAHNYHVARKVCDVAMNIVAHDFKKDVTSGKLHRIDTDYQAPHGSLPTELFIGKRC